MSTKKLPCGDNFSERLKSLRGERNKAEFSRFLGIAPAVYQRYEDGRIPNPKHLSVISERCQVTIDWLLGNQSAAVAPAGPMVVREDMVAYGTAHDEIQRIHDEQEKISAEIGRLQQKFHALALKTVDILVNNGHAKRLTEQEVEDIKRRAAARAAERASVNREDENKQEGGPER